MGSHIVGKFYQAPFTTTGHGSMEWSSESSSSDSSCTQSPEYSQQHLEYVNNEEFVEGSSQCGYLLQIDTSPDLDRCNLPFKTQSYERSSSNNYYGGQPPAHCTALEVLKAVREGCEVVSIDPDELMDDEDQDELVYQQEDIQSENDEVEEQEECESEKEQAELTFRQDKFQTEKENSTEKIDDDNSHIIIDRSNNIEYCTVEIKDDSIDSHDLIDDENQEELVYHQEYIQNEKFEVEEHEEFQSEKEGKELAYMHICHVFSQDKSQTEKEHSIAKRDDDIPHVNVERSNNIEHCTVEIKNESVVPHYLMDNENQKELVYQQEYIQYKKYEMEEQEELVHKQEEFQSEKESTEKRDDERSLIKIEKSNSTYHTTDKIKCDYQFANDTSRIQNYLNPAISSAHDVHDKQQRVEDILKIENSLLNSTNVYYKSKIPTSSMPSESTETHSIKAEAMQLNLPQKSVENEDNLNFLSPAEIPSDLMTTDWEQFGITDDTNLSVCIPFSKKKSFSEPQTPMHWAPLDYEDGRVSQSWNDLSFLSLPHNKALDTSNPKNEPFALLPDEVVNGFFITQEPKNIVTEDNLTVENMEIDKSCDVFPENFLSTADKGNVLEFCVERSSVKTENTSSSAHSSPLLDLGLFETENKKINQDLEDILDIESCNDVATPVLEANTINSLLEQFEANEELNKQSKSKSTSLIEKETSCNDTTVNKKLSGVVVKTGKVLFRPTKKAPNSSHTNRSSCTQKIRRPSVVKGGQSLLKPEVLSSNNKILQSRHRSCKDKKVIYKDSDDELECNKLKNKKSKRDDDVEFTINKKPSVKVSSKTAAFASCRKKLSPKHNVSNDMYKNKVNRSVIDKIASKASDIPNSVDPKANLKLTIKNKCEVVLNCDANVSENSNKNKGKCKNSSTSDKNVKQTNSNDNNTQNITKIQDTKSVVCNSGKVSNDITENSETENFYTSLFSNKQDVQIPEPMEIKNKNEKKTFEEELNMMSDMTNKNKTGKQKKRLKFDEYKKRKTGTSNNSSTTVSPEPIFPDVPSPNALSNKIQDKNNKTPCVSLPVKVEQKVTESSKVTFDPIRQASLKALKFVNKQKAMKPRDEDIIMSKIPKVGDLEIKKLISDTVIFKMVNTDAAKNDQLSVESQKLVEVKYPEEIVTEMKSDDPIKCDKFSKVSVGVNTDENLLIDDNSDGEKSQTPASEPKSLINFKIKKNEHVLKQNVFEAVNNKKNKNDESKRATMRIDKKRYKDITATIKSVEKQVDNKISSLSLFASIQDVVLKKAPENVAQKLLGGEQKRWKSNLPTDKRDTKTTITRDCETKTHTKNEVIHVVKNNRTKPDCSNVKIQTNTVKSPNPTVSKHFIIQEKKSTQSRTNDRIYECRPGDTKTVNAQEKTSNFKEKIRPKDCYGDTKYRHGPRSQQKNKKRSWSRSRSKSLDRYKRYRRSNSPHQRSRSKNRSRSRNRSRSNFRSPSVRRDYRSRSRSRSRLRSRSRSRSQRSGHNRTRSPTHKKIKLISPHTLKMKGRKSNESSVTVSSSRKLTTSECSASSSCTSSTSSSSKSRSSTGSGSYSSESNTSKTQTTNNRDSYYWKNEYKRSYSPKDRQNNTPVEERRIVFVGKLEDNIKKQDLYDMFIQYGKITDVRLYLKEDKSHYGFVTYQKAKDAYKAVENKSKYPKYDVGFGGRRAFCRQSYADLDGLEAEYTESAYYGQPSALPARRSNMSFDEMLQDAMKVLKTSSGRHDGKA